MSMASFINEFKPYADVVSQATSLPTELILSQWGHETGWGTSKLFKENKNLAGITNPGGGYASYASYEEAAAGYIDIVSLSRYKNVLSAGDPYKSAQELEKAGYATDPGYAEKLSAIIPGVKKIMDTGTTYTPETSISTHEPTLKEKVNAFLHKYAPGSVAAGIAEKDQWTDSETGQEYSPLTGQPVINMSIMQKVGIIVAVVFIGLVMVYTLGQAYGPQLEPVTGTANKIKEVVT